MLEKMLIHNDDLVCVEVAECGGSEEKWMSAKVKCRRSLNGARRAVDSRP